MGESTEAASVGAERLVSVSEPSAAGSQGFFRLVWGHWKKAAHAVGVVQTRIMMIAFYFVVVLPLGLIMRMGNDKLHLRRPVGSSWIPHDHRDETIESAHRQF